jgi:hypothetical protein
MEDSLLEIEVLLESSAFGVGVQTLDFLVRTTSVDIAWFKGIKDLVVDLDLIVAMVGAQHELKQFPNSSSL